MGKSNMKKIKMSAIFLVLNSIHLVLNGYPRHILPFSAVYSGNWCEAFLIIAYFAIYLYCLTYYLCPKNSKELFFKLLLVHCAIDWVYFNITFLFKIIGYVFDILYIIFNWILIYKTIYNYEIKISVTSKWWTTIVLTAVLCTAFDILLTLRESMFMTDTFSSISLPLKC